MVSRETRGNPVGFLVPMLVLNLKLTTILFLFNKKSMIIICDVPNSVLPYISGLGTAAVELQKIHNEF